MIVQIISKILEWLNWSAYLLTVELKLTIILYNNQQTATPIKII